MKIYQSRGFTIIELLIVIAIIAVLTAIVLVNVIAYINQSRDASIQANLSSILTNASKFNDDNSTYTGFCTDLSYTNPSAAINNIGGITQSCHEIGATLCACASLRTNSANVFCVDSSGTKKRVESTDCDTECDATTAQCL